jgi:hypothetical protein
VHVDVPQPERRHRATSSSDHLAIANFGNAIARYGCIEELPLTFVVRSDGLVWIPLLESEHSEISN